MESFYLYKILKKVRFRLLVFATLILLIGCSTDDDRDFSDASNLRLKSYSYQYTAGFIKTDFAYNELGQLFKITDNFRVKELLYDEKGRIINNGHSTISYDNNDRISEILFNNGGVYKIEYNVFGEISKIVAKIGDEIITDYEYDSNNNLIKTIERTFSNDRLFSTSINDFFYDDNDRVIRETSGVIYPGQVFELIYERFYEYSNQLNPFRLLYEKIGVDPDNVVFNIGFNLEGGINLGGTIWRTKFPKYMFKKTEEKGKFQDNFYVDFNYSSNAYGFPVDGAKVMTSSRDIVISTEESWEYEELLASLKN